MKNIILLKGRKKYVEVVDTVYIRLVSRDVVYKFSKMFTAQIGTYYTVIPDL